MSSEEMDVVDAEVVLSEQEALDFDVRFQSAIGSYAEARSEVIECVEVVRTTDVAEKLNFKSRGDYVADRVAGLNVRWAIEDRRSLVELMAFDPSGGMSTRQIGSALGVSKDTAARDMATVANATDEPRRVESSDGRVRTYAPEPDSEQRTPPAPPKPRRRPITDAYFEAVYDLRKVVERLERLTEDDRFPKNKNEIARVRKSDLVRTADTLASILRQFD